MVLLAATATATAAVSVATTAATCTTSTRHTVVAVVVVAVAAAAVEGMVMNEVVVISSGIVDAAALILKVGVEVAVAETVV